MARSSRFRKASGANCLGLPDRLGGLPRPRRAGGSAGASPSAFSRPVLRHQMRYHGLARPRCRRGHCRRGKFAVEGRAGRRQAARNAVPEAQICHSRRHPSPRQSASRCRRPGAGRARPSRAFRRRERLVRSSRRGTAARGSWLNARAAGAVRSGGTGRRSGRGRPVWGGTARAAGGTTPSASSITRRPWSARRMLPRATLTSGIRTPSGPER